MHTHTYHQHKKERKTQKKCNIFYFYFLSPKRENKIQICKEKEKEKSKNTLKKVHAILKTGKVITLKSPMVVGEWRGGGGSSGQPWERVLPHGLDTISPTPTLCSGHRPLS